MDSLNIFLIRLFENIKFKRSNILNGFFFIVPTRDIPPHLRKKKIYYVVCLTRINKYDTVTCTDNNYVKCIYSK